MDVGEFVNRIENVFWCNIERFLNQFENVTQSGVYSNEIIKVLSEDNLRFMFFEGWRYMSELTKVGFDTWKLQDIFLTMLSREIIVECDDGSVKITPKLEDALSYLREFVQSIDNNKVIFLVDSYTPMRSVT